jgi:hypothetical protein
MSDSFLSRWSRRKREAREAEREPDGPAEAEEQRAGGEAGQQAAEKVPAEPEEPALTPEEIAELPKLEELTAETDISVFLRKGVPEPLRNAALRRMWSLDPAIRDFVGEARDYGYDWNTPGGVPGAGELLPGDDVTAMLRGVFGESEPQLPQMGQSGVEASRVRDDQALSASQTENAAALQQSSTADRPGSVGQGIDPKNHNAFNKLKPAEAANNGAASQNSSEAALPDAAASRRHGGAKPV